MRVGLNVSVANGKLAGIGNYAFHLATHLPLVAPSDQWILFGPDKALFADAGVAVIRCNRGTARIVWEQLILPLAARKEQVDLLHGADFSRPVAYGRPTVNTIHDLSPFADQHFFPLSKRSYKKSLISFVVRASRAIITVSEFSRRELLSRFPFLDGKIFTVHLGVEPTPQVNRVENDRPFLLFVGTMEHRKNVVTLIRAFGMLTKRRRLPHRLVLVGKPGYGWDAIQNLIEESQLADAIDVLGYATPQRLAQLYHSASLFVYPSLYEGFGLPVLEAMASGTPVISSSATSLPEVGGDAAIYFEPHNVEQLADAIEAVLDSPTLQSQLRVKGSKQAAKFTWEKCARQHVDVYRKVLQQ